MNEDDKNINITSNNQSGGITAYNVNLGKPQRQINSQWHSTLDKVISDNPNWEIKIITEMNDRETYNLGEQVLTYLKSKGHSVPGGVGRMMANRPLPTTVNINAKKICIEIYIGSQ